MSMHKKINNHICNPLHSVHIVDFSAVQLSGRTYWQPRLVFYLNKRHRIIFGVTYADGGPSIMPSEYTVKQLLDIAQDRHWSADKITQLQSRLTELGLTK